MKIKIPEQIKRNSTLLSGFCILGGFLAIIALKLPPGKIILVSGLLIAAIMDIMTGYIWNKFIAIFFAIGLISILYNSELTTVLVGLLNLTIAFFIIMLIRFLFKKQIGIGDVLILTTVSEFGGLLFYLRVMFMTFIISGLIGLILLSAKRASTKTTMKFVPFILFGAISTLFTT